MNKKHTFKFYSEYDTKGITEFLNTMAVKGWLLEKRSGVYYRFVKTDKAFTKYDITYFADASKDNDYLPYGADRYFEMRQAAGWQFVTNDNKMMIFSSENPDAPPLETEPMMKVDVIHSIDWPTSATMMMISTIWGTDWKMSEILISRLSMRPPL